MQPTTTQQIPTSFRELRHTTERMLSLVQRTVGGEERLTLQTSLNLDLGVAGLDWDMFLEAYETEFGTTLDGLSYESYFDGRVTIHDIALIPLRLFWRIGIFLPLWLIGIHKRHIPFYREPAAITIGDLVVSTIAGRFAKRAEIKLIISS